MGKWIEERTFMECPNCHDIWHYEKNQTERFNFCPNCGNNNVEYKTQLKTKLSIKREREDKND